MSEFILKDAGLAEVIATINELIEESVYHTETFAHALQAHRNQKAAEVFLHAVDQFKKELELVRKYREDIQVSTIAPWEVPHAEYMHPSVLLMDAHYLMTEEEAWNIIDKMIKIHQDFYVHLSQESEDEDVISLSKQLIEYCNACGRY